MPSRVIARSVVMVTFVLAFAPRAFAQSASPETAALQALSPDELAALRPLAQRGIAFVIRDAAAGTRARTTLLTRAHAPIATVHDVLASPDRYAEFLDGIDRTEIQSRFQNRIAFRFHTAAGLFSADTIGSMHLIGASRIDGAFTQSQLGPGSFRWDLYPDGDGTLIAYTTSGDPSQVNWFLRALTRGEPSTIAGIQTSYNGILVLAVSLRAETLAGNSAHGAFESVSTANAASEPPPVGAWSSLARNEVVGATALDAHRDVIGSTVAIWTAASSDIVRDHLLDIAHYRQCWSEFRTVDSVPTSGANPRFRSVADSALAHTEGDQEIVVEANDRATRVTWRGISGDYAGVAHRWDLVPADGGGTTIVLTSGTETNGAGLMMRTVITMGHWIVAGYSVAWKMRWMLPFVHWVEVPAASTRP